MEDVGEVFPNGFTLVKLPIAFSRGFEVIIPVLRFTGTYPPLHISRIPKSEEEHAMSLESLQSM